MGIKIPTATGSIDSNEIGLTTMHEHVVPYLGPLPQYKADSIDFAIKELKKAKIVGLKTLVEVSPWRDAEIIKTIAEKSEVNIILCTGFYAYFNEEQNSYSIDKFRKHMMDEIENGIGKTGILPGVIKIGSANTVPNEVERRALLAAGLVQKETGLPLCVHSVTGCKNQQDIFEEAGADLSKIYFSHIEAEFGWEGRTIEDEIDYLEDIIKKGSYLSYNNFGNWAHTKEENLLKLITELNASGYSDKQFATLDFIWSYENGIRKILWEDINPEGKERSYEYLLKKVLPWMYANGISNENSMKMVWDNPQKLFNS
jgi:phosphotriesterase-related protein